MWRELHVRSRVTLSGTLQKKKEVGARGWGGGEGGKGRREKERKGPRLASLSREILSVMFGNFFISFLLLSDDIKLTLSDPYRRREDNEEESVKQGHLKQQGQERWAQRMELSL